MRAKSKKTGGYIVYAVSGTNTISFAIDFTEANIKGLLGFAVERIDKTNGERKFMDGFKVFKELVPKPNPDTVVNTYTHPIQSFVWDDFTCYEGHDYEYMFYPLKGKPTNIDRSAAAIVVSISTEALFTDNIHDVFFNRGVASSQAYRRKFFNLPPDPKKMKDAEMLAKALAWLSRDLDNAILKFIGDAKSGETLLGCFYEFHYEPVVKAFKVAADNGVNVRLIIDAKKNGGSTDEDSDSEDGDANFPRDINLATIKNVGLKKSNVILREAKKNDIQHNKFIVLLDKNGIPKQVWTGSTNISNGGIHGQTNVGHWVKDENTAAAYKQYWDILSNDPGGQEGDDASTIRKKNDAFKKAVADISPDLDFNSWEDVPAGITPLFSPRAGLKVLESYANMFDNAENMACITLAFGINKTIKEKLEDNTADRNAISFMLLEKEDKPNARSKAPFVFVGAQQNVYKAWGSYIDDKLYGWARESSTKGLGLNTHVAYVHSKFMLVDPLSNDSVVVTGSANFSNASTNNNDENMIVIRGDRRVSDIYYTEFNRLFNHYYFRSIYNSLQNKIDEKKKLTGAEQIFLMPNSEWTKSYEKGKLRYKRIDMFTKMDI